MLLSFAFLNFPHFVNSQTRYGLQHDQDFMNHQHLIQRKFQASFRYNCTLKHLSQSQPQIRNAEQKLNLVTEKKNGNNVGLMVRLVAEKNTVKNFPIFLFQRFPPISRKPNRARKTISVEKVLTGCAFGRPLTSLHLLSNRYVFRGKRAGYTAPPRMFYTIPIKETYFK